MEIAQLLTGSTMDLIVHNSENDRHHKINAILKTLLGKLHNKKAHNNYEKGMNDPMSIEKK